MTSENPFHGLRGIQMFILHNLSCPSKHNPNTPTGRSMHWPLSVSVTANKGDRQFPRITWRKSSQILEVSEAAWTPAVMQLGLTLGDTWALLTVIYSNIKLQDYQVYIYIQERREGKSSMPFHMWDSVKCTAYFMNLHQVVMVFKERIHFLKVFRFSGWER